MAADPSLLKKAASLLLKGGTLTSEQCADCGAPQVRFEGKLLCINCGKRIAEQNEVVVHPNNISSEKQETVIPAPHASALLSAGTAIEEKIRALALEINEDIEDHLAKEKAELIQSLLDITERIRKITSR